MKKYKQELAVGVFVFIGLLGIAYMSVKLGNVKMFSNDYMTLSAPFTKITGLKINAPVNMYGVEVGYVSRISLDLEGEQTRSIPVAVVEMQIRKEYSIDNEAIASIKTSGLIGDKFVDISLGMGEEVLMDGDAIFDTNPAIDLEDLIGKFATSGE
ncbi:MAG: MCE family protein [Proteobacteria bacterium]|nr:MCE family protein [Pseudomonadota bacterium]MBU1610715.1 MCE family protein [Pseudomonadota bacterium]